MGTDFIHDDLLLLLLVSHLIWHFKHWLFRVSHHVVVLSLDSCCGDVVVVAILLGRVLECQLIAHELARARTQVDYCSTPCIDSFLAPLSVEVHSPFISAWYTLLLLLERTLFWLLLGFRWELIRVRLHRVHVLIFCLQVLSATCVNSLRLVAVVSVILLGALAWCIIPLLFHLCI